MSKNNLVRLVLSIFYLVVFGVAYYLSVSPIPVEECPPNAGVAADGSCGIYKRDVMQAFNYTFFFAVLPSILILDVKMLSNRFHKNEKIDDQVEDQVPPIGKP